MSLFVNPALKQFVAHIGNELVLAQVLIKLHGTGWDLCHLDDRQSAPESLRIVGPAETRSLAQSTAAGEFRPLKSAPTLQSGWCIHASDDSELDLALQSLYPGSVADWHAAQAANPPITHFREYAARQSGMYRITARLTDAQAAGVILATCDKTHCLKRRFWSVTGLEPDNLTAKSLIPCLEPCAVLLEAARQAARAAQTKEG